MTATRDELRDHLTAVIEAARELPREDRTFLADTFLDDLDRQYRLVPRSTGSDMQVSSRPSRHVGFPLGWGKIALLAVLALFVLPLLFSSLFALAHPPIFLFVLVLFLVFRFARPGRSWRGPRGGGRTYTI